MISYEVGLRKIVSQMSNFKNNFKLGVMLILLLMMTAQECGLIPGIFVHTLGDAHIYSNHIDGLKLQLTRTPKPLPQVKIARKNIFDLTFEDIELIGYQHDAFIKFPISV